MWSLPFSRRIFVASTTAPVSPRLCDTCFCTIPYLGLVVSYHREHDIDRFLASPFLTVLLLLSAISYGSFLIFSKSKAVYLTKVFLMSGPVLNSASLVVVLVECQLCLLLQISPTC